MMGSGLLTIHEHFTRVPKPQLREMGWTKVRELVKEARKDGAEFVCAPWVHKARELPKEQFKREVERHSTGKETEAWEILYFKVYKSQLDVVKRAPETAAPMLGSDSDESGGLGTLLSACSRQFELSRMDIFVACTIQPMRSAR